MKVLQSEILSFEIAATRSSLQPQKAPALNDARMTRQFANATMCILGISHAHKAPLTKSLQPENAGPAKLIYPVTTA